MPQILRSPKNSIGFPNWLRQQTARQDVIGALARAVTAVEVRRGRRFHGAGDLFNALRPHGGPALRRALDLGLAEWRLCHLPQMRFAVDDDGRVAVLVDSERPLVRKGDYRKPHVMTKGRG
jgi:hypothetical protein